jgi:hypothetical protein
VRTAHTAAFLLATIAPPALLAEDLPRTLLADAGARASFQAGGHDGKFFLADAPGEHRLNISGQVQMRYHLNRRDTAPPDEDLATGFTMRRVKLGFDGVVGGAWTYKIVGAFSRASGDFELEDVVIGHELDNGLTVAAGQFKLPLLREESVSSKYQLAADRSVTNEVFNQDRSQGVQLAWEGERARLLGALSDGLRTRNTAYYAPSEADLALSARAEFRLGEAAWRAYRDFTSFRGGASGALIGVAAHWQTAGETANTDTFGGSAPTETDTLLYTVDGAYEGGGWNVYGAFIGRSTETSGAADFDDFGAVLQGGVFLTERAEAFARWDGVFPDDARAAGDDFHTLTFGGNYYFFPGSHAAKFTADLVWYLDDQAGSADLVRTNEGVGLGPTDGDDQYTVRVQMQLLF